MAASGNSLSNREAGCGHCTRLLAVQDRTDFLSGRILGAAIRGAGHGTRFQRAALKLRMPLGVRDAR